jgi:hypothetical protein
MSEAHHAICFTVARLEDLICPSEKRFSIVPPKLPPTAPRSRKSRP